MYPKINLRSPVYKDITVNGRRIVNSNKCYDWTCVSYGCGINDLQLEIKQLGADGNHLRQYCVWNFEEIFLIPEDYLKSQVSHRNGEHDALLGNKF